MRSWVAESYGLRHVEFWCDELIFSTTWEKTLNSNNSILFYQPASTYSSFASESPLVSCPPPPPPTPRTSSPHTTPVLIGTSWEEMLSAEGEYKLPFFCCENRIFRFRRMGEPGI